MTDLWRQSEIDEALRLRASGMKYKDIARKVRRSASAVRSRLDRDGVESRHWSEAQDAVLKQNRGLSHSKLAEMASEVGPTRTRLSVRSRMRYLGLSSTSRVIAKAAAPKGWPTMRGADDDRDAEFVLKVLREARRLGLVRTSPIKPQSCTAATRAPLPFPENPGRLVTEQKRFG